MPSPTGPPSVNLELRDYLAVLRRRKLLIALITVTGPTDATQTWVEARYAAGFGQFHPARSLVTTARSPLPATFTTRIEAAPLPGGASGPVHPPR